MEEAERLRVQHLQDHPNYKYRPRRKKTTKKLKRVEPGLLLHSLAQADASCLGIGPGTDATSGGSVYGHAVNLPPNHPSHHLSASNGGFRDLQAGPAHLELESYGLPTPEMSPLDVLEEGAGESVFFPQHMQEDAGTLGWSSYQQLHHHNQHYSQSYNHSSIQPNYSQSSGMAGPSISARMNSSPRSSRVDPRLSKVELVTSGLAGPLNSRLNPASAHHIALRSPVKFPASLSDSASSLNFSPLPVGLPQPIKSQQMSQHPAPPAGYFSYASSMPSYHMPPQLGQLSPPPETPSPSCSSSSIIQATFSNSVLLEHLNPETSSHLSSPSGEFWSEVDGHEFDQWNTGRIREEVLGHSIAMPKAQSGRGVASVMNADDGNSSLISALSDASSAVYYSTCITG